VILLPIYKYKAISATGDSVTGTYNAKVKDEVFSMLRENNYYPVQVEEIIEGKNLTFHFIKKVKVKDIAVFCRQFYVMLNAGVPIINCLNILRLQAENNKLKQAIGEVYENVQRGLSLSESLRNHQDIFPELLINMVEAGESSGKLDVVMDRMADHFEKENKIKGKIQGAMIYPIILCIVAVIVVTVLLVFVMPTFIQSFSDSGIELPLPTRILLAVSNGIRKYWYFIVLILFGSAFAFMQYIKTEKGRLAFDAFKLRIPVFSSQIKKIITSRFTRTLSTLLSSGIPLLQALDMVAKVVGNEVVADGIKIAKEEVRKGADLSGPIRAIGIFPPMVESMIKIGEESGSLDDILERTANFYDEEVEIAMQKMTTMIEPIMIVIMGVIVGFIVISMMLPMTDMMKTI